MREEYFERFSCDWSEDSVRLIHTPSQTARSTYFYIQEAGYFKTNPAYFTERKNLNSFLILYTISGKGKLFYEGEQYQLDKGKCFYINCMNHHLYQNDEKEEWEFLWFHFQGMNARGYYEEFVRSGFRILSIEDEFLFQSTMRRLIAIHQKTDVTTEIAASKLIIVLLTELLIQNSTGNRKHIFLPDYLKKIMKDIDKCFRDSHSLDFFAHKYGISKYHLAKEFKRYVGTTLNEYIIRTRLTHAKELLKYSDMSIGEIAEASGIFHVSHFINLFKKREGMTPNIFRKEWKG